MLTTGGYNTRRRANLKSASSLQKEAESILISLNLLFLPLGPPELVFDDPTDLPDHLLGVVGMYSCAGYNRRFKATINQDRAGVRCPLGRPNTAFLAVYDGHGPEGQTVSEFANNEIPKRLEEHEAFPHDLERALEETVLGVDQDLDQADDSGTTACGGVLQDDMLTLFNVGHSRAVLGSKSSNDVVSSKHLTKVHKPLSLVNREEISRIRKAGGIIWKSDAKRAIQAFVQVDTKAGYCNILGMTRSIGDHDFRVAGVIAQPEVTTYKITPKDKVLIIATDGFWDAISYGGFPCIDFSKEAVKTVLSHLHQGPAKAAQALIEKARERCEIGMHDGVLSDDITAIVVDLTKWRDQVEATKATLVEQQSETLGRREPSNSSNKKGSTLRRSVRLLNKNK